MWRNYLKTYCHISEATIKVHLHSSTKKTVIKGDSANQKLIKYPPLVNRNYWDKLGSIFEIINLEVDKILGSTTKYSQLDEDVVPLVVILGNPLSRLLTGRDDHSVGVDF